MSLEDLEPFGYEWELEQQERMFGEAPYEGEHAIAHREAAQLGLYCPFDCDPDHGWDQVGDDEWVRHDQPAPAPVAEPTDPWV